MSKQRKKSILLMMLSILMATMLVGCGNSTPKIDKVEQSEIYITKDGNVTAYLVEVFDKEYYDAAELEQMIQTEIEDFIGTANAGEDDGTNGEEEGPAVVFVDILTPAEKNASVVENGANTITVQIEYTDGAAYTAFNDKVLFFGTVAQAETSGYPIKTDLKSISGEEVLKKADASEMSDNHILMFEESITVHVPYEVLYASEGVTVDGKTVSFEGTEGKVATVIMK